MANIKIKMSLYNIMANPEDYNSYIIDAWNLNANHWKVYSDGNGSDFEYYENGTHSTNWSGPFSSTSGDVKYERCGNRVTLHFPTVAGTSNAAATIVSSTALPTRLRPNSTVYFNHIVKDAGSNGSNGRVSISSTGVITFGTGINLSGGNFTNSLGLAQAGFYSSAVTYLV